MRGEIFDHGNMNGCFFMCDASIGQLNAFNGSIRFHWGGNKFFAKVQWKDVSFISIHFQFLLFSHSPFQKVYDWQSTKWKINTMCWTS